MGDEDYTVKLDGGSFCRSFYSSRLELITPASLDEKNSSLVARLDSIASGDITNRGMELEEAYLREFAAESNSLEGSLSRETVEIVDATARSTTRSARVRPRFEWFCD